LGLLGAVIYDLEFTVGGSKFKPKSPTPNSRTLNQMERLYRYSTQQ